MPVSADDGELLFSVSNRLWQQGKPRFPRNVDASSYKEEGGCFFVRKKVKTCACFLGRTVNHKEKTNKKKTAPTQTQRTIVKVSGGDLHCAVDDATMVVQPHNARGDRVNGSGIYIQTGVCAMWVAENDRL